MRVYTVYEPGEPAKSLDERADDIVFVKEGFTWLGFLLPPIWLLANRLWLELAVAFLVTGGIAAGLVGFGLGEQGPVVACLLLALIIGFEGNDLKRWRLERKDYVFLASVAGVNFEACEKQFFDAWLPHMAIIVGPSPGRPRNGQRSSSAGGGDWQGPSVIGTLPGAMG